MRKDPALSFPGQCVPKKTIMMMRLFEDPASHEDTQKGPGVFCVKESKLRSVRIIMDTIGVFKYSEN